MRLNFIVFLCIAFVLISICTGCGGGKGSEARPSVTNIVTVPSGSGANANLGEITLKVPPTAFPSGAQLTITQREPNTLPPAPGVSSIGSMGQIEILCSTPPQAPIEIDLNSTALSTRYWGEEQLNAIVQKTEEGWQRVTDFASDQYKLYVDANKFDDAINGWAFAGNLISILDIAYDANTEFVQVGGINNDAPYSGKDPNRKKVLVAVHGFLGNGDQMEPILQRYMSTGRYYCAYTYKFDWRSSCTDMATALKEYINGLYDQGYMVDIIAHSMGVAISRYTLEYLGCTKGVENLYAFCGANLGSPLPASDLGRDLETMYLNKLNGWDDPLGYPRESIPSMVDLTTDSTFLAELNSPSIVQRGYVNYYILAANPDGVVGNDSSYGEGVSLAALTNGTVKKCFLFSYQIPGSLSWTAKYLNHIVAFQDSAYWSAINAFTSPGEYGGVDLSVYPNPADADYDHWSYTITLTNWNDSAVYLEDLCCDMYDANGIWEGMIWVDDTPSGIEYPHDYSPLYTSLSGNNEYTWNMTRFRGTISNYTPIWTLPSYQQRGTDIYTARYSLDGQEYLTVYYVTLTYNGFYPDTDPNTRSYQLRSAAANRALLAGQNTRIPPVGLTCAQQAIVKHSGKPDLAKRMLAHKGSKVRAVTYLIPKNGPMPLGLPKGQ